MARMQVSCDTLGDLDGGAARAIIDSAIREAVNDLEDRAAQDGKPRKAVVTLTFDLMDNNDVLVSVQAGTKLPDRKTATTVAEVKRRDGRAQLTFSQYAPEDPKQSTVDEYENRRGD